VNWSMVGQVAGEDSVDPLHKRFPGKQTKREFYWTTEDSGGAGPRIDPYNVRVAVNSVEGEEIEIEAFVRTPNSWFPLRYTRENGSWVRKLADHDGKPLEYGCIKCHGAGPSFGPTPKGLANFKRPRGWLEIRSKKDPNKVELPRYINSFFEPGDSYTGH